MAQYLGESEVTSDMSQRSEVADIAYKMLTDNVPEELIIRYTNLTFEELEKLKLEMKTPIHLGEHHTIEDWIFEENIQSTRWLLSEQYSESAIMRILGITNQEFIHIRKVLLESSTLTTVKKMLRDGASDKQIITATKISESELDCIKSEQAAEVNRLFDRERGALAARLKIVTNFLEYGLGDEAIWERVDIAPDDLKLLRSQWLDKKLCKSSPSSDWERGWKSEQMAIARRIWWQSKMFVDQSIHLTGISNDESSRFQKHFEYKQNKIDGFCQGFTEDMEVSVPEIDRLVCDLYCLKEAKKMVDAQIVDLDIIVFTGISPETLKRLKCDESGSMISELHTLIYNYKVACRLLLNKFPDDKISDITEIPANKLADLKYQLRDHLK